ncbi:putative RDD family membrane protein YckC [Haloactinopolyspora alba]|uniref:Putative RDD family membrane protein YckC n=1 Tax=Haloactinopolyspora alba TaxID=648780 RepID=A0A2P8DL18_9ACTN|nr:RDD family protein [Haloactinopolyspora alba]PSK97913.1 putative RDD family membrane protein YckC [Haloactinopolyspora alba]
MSDLVTGEAVPLELRRAKLPSRALSFTLDALLLAGLAVGLLLLLGQVTPDVDQALAFALVIGSVVFVLVIVPTTLETLTRGKSLGKLALGLRVVRDDGGPIRFRHALVRALAGVFADFVVTAGLGAVLCSLLNPRDKRIGDVLAGTIVIRERIPTVDATPPAVHPRLTEWAASLELSRLPDGLAMSARSLLARAPQLAPDIRDRLATDLAAQVAQVVSPPPPPGTPASVYLAAVLGERRRRDSLRYDASAGWAAPQPGRSADEHTTPPVPPEPDAGETPDREPDEGSPPNPPRTGGGFVPPG